MDAGFKLNYTLTSDFAIAGDMNPGEAGGNPIDSVSKVTAASARKEMSNANSNNHNGDGQNVLYADGHVEFQNTPFAGMQRGIGTKGWRDNIYTGVAAESGKSTKGGAPVDQLDTILLPTDDVGGK
jgi:prepilin-type processing-associated H-X9-DG protein